MLTLHRTLLVVTGLSLALIGAAYLTDPNLLLNRYGLSTADGRTMKPHCIEIVSETVDEQRELLVQVHGLSFAAQDKDLGGARVAKTSGEAG
ncbi:MAG: hypothetical protein AAGI72_09905 [Pseudomonadota bacterium]